jgi:peptidoglycan/LPS O-acetylase OafA/YrhL
MSTVSGEREDAGAVASDVALSTTETETTPPVHTRGADYRPEIDGLRAIAVLVIVGFHVGLAGFHGGFIGVDVFFIISGYLITRILMRWLGSSTKPSLAEFWARRVRRLVPALTVVVVSVLLLGAFFVYSPLYWPDMARAGLASSFWVSNVFYARQATNYFAATPGASPFLHTWSLGVEEQFYLFWPLLFLIPAGLAKRSLASARQALFVTLASVVVISFGLSYLLSRRGSPWAFFSSPTRAWEFGAAGLLAIVLAKDTRIPPRAIAFAGWAGLAAIILGTVRLSQTVPYPGTAALIPVLGTMALLLPAPQGITWSTASLLSVRPLRWIGRVSYSWYLWHWPLIVFADVVTRHSSTRARLVAALIALGLAALTKVFIEDRVRFSKVLMSSAARTFTMGLALVAVMALVSVSVLYIGRVERRDDSLLRSLLAARDWPQHVKCTHVDGRCYYGDASSTRTIILAGDSHASHWIPALDAAARAMGDRLLVRASGDCPLPRVRIVNPITGHASQTCSNLRGGTRRAIKELHPVAVVVGTFSGYKGRIAALNGRTEQQDWTDAFAALAEDLHSQHIPLVVALDDPALSFDPVECIAKHRSVSFCTPSRSKALAVTEPFNTAVEAGLRKAGYGSTYDPTSAICDAVHCNLQVGGDYVFADPGHLTYRFALAQADQWQATLERAINGSGSSTAQ